jgi:hypothetical protein
VARSSLPDDLVYAIAEASSSLSEKTLMQASHAAAESVPANFTRNTLLPFHPGHEALDVVPLQSRNACAKLDRLLAHAVRLATAATGSRSPPG